MSIKRVKATPEVLGVIRTMDFTQENGTVLGVIKSEFSRDLYLR